MDTESEAKSKEEDSFTNPQLKIDELPRWEEVNYEALASAAPWESFWYSMITLVLGLVFGVGSLLVSSAPIYVSVLVVGLMLLFFGLLQWHNFAEHKKRGVAAREKDILFRKGLFWRESSVLPYNRVQHIEIHRSPLERKLRLSSLRIFTAGGSGVDLQIKGLEKPRAEKLKQYILDRAKGADVEQ